MPPGQEDVARGFFTGVLTMAEVPKPEALAGRGGVWFRAGDVDLHLGVEDDFRPARKAHPAIVVDDIDALTGRLADAGQPTTPGTELPGYLRVYAHDPFGNRLEFVQPAQ